MRYYFFRDLENEPNYNGDRSHHAAGIVDKLYCELEYPNFSGKDTAVIFINPFTCFVEREWRPLNEIELFEVSEYEYNELLESYKIIEAL